MHEEELDQGKPGFPSCEVSKNATCLFLLSYILDQYFIKLRNFKLMMMRKCFVLLSILEMVNFLFKPCFISQSKILIREVTSTGLFGTSWRRLWCLSGLLEDLPYPCFNRTKPGCCGWQKMVSEVCHYLAFLLGTLSPIPEIPGR